MGMQIPQAQPSPWGSYTECGQRGIVPPDGMVCKLAALGNSSSLRVLHTRFKTFLVFWPGVVQPKELTVKSLARQSSKGFLGLCGSFKMNVGKASGLPVVVATTTKRVHNVVFFYGKKFIQKDGQCFFLCRKEKVLQHQDIAGRTPRPRTRYVCRIFAHPFCFPLLGFWWTRETHHGG